MPGVKICLLETWNMEYVKQMNNQQRNTKTQDNDGILGPNNKELSLNEPWQRDARAGKSYYL